MYVSNMCVYVSLCMKTCEKCVGKCSCYVCLWVCVCVCMEIEGYMRMCM